ncbi:MAG: PDZ domain-containing protein [Clostridiaceae bacterium]|nr:PDZ domain-containing protein [Clostridiaceae bacterium]
MKKFSLLLIFIFTCHFIFLNYTNIANATDRISTNSLNDNNYAKVCKNSYGFYYTYDPYLYNSWTGKLTPRIFIIKVVPQSPAANAGLVVGDEIIKINDVKVNNLTANAVFNILQNNTTTTFDIESNDIKKILVMTKTDVCLAEYNDNIDELFDKSWYQISNFNIDAAIEYLRNCTLIENKLSKKFINSELSGIDNQIRYWMPKKNQFKIGYDLCKNNSKSSEETYACIQELVNRTIAQVMNDKSVEQQQALLLQQQQLQQNQINAINNYSYALQNQHLQVDQNVNYSGTVNANIYHSGTINTNSNSNINAHIWNY